MQLKGRQLAFLLLLCSGWAVARIALLSLPPDVVPTASIAPVASYNERYEEKLRQPGPVVLTPQASSAIGPHGPLGKQGFWKITPMAVPPEPSLPKRPESTALASFLTPPAPPQPKPPADPYRPSFPTPPLATTTAQKSQFAEIYAYSYWRWDAKGSGLAAAGQYGGSQSGLIVAIPIHGIRIFDNAENVALLFRAAVAPDSRADREVAIGVRYRPVSALPLTVTAERRFRPVGPDRMAVYVAGGVDDIALPGKFRLDGYAQSGFVSGRGAGRFIDASARVHRPVYTEGILSAKAGGGAWAGGQRGAFRLDVGPTVSADVSLGGARVRLNADWRFRIAGNARPGNGPALTLSTSF